MGKTPLLVEASVAVGGWELRAVLVVHRPFRQELAVLGKEFVALEVGSRELFLELLMCLTRLSKPWPSLGGLVKTTSSATLCLSSSRQV